MLDYTKGFFSDKSINVPSRNVASLALRTKTKTNNRGKRKQIEKKIILDF